MEHNQNRFAREAAGDEHRQFTSGPESSAGGLSEAPHETGPSVPSSSLAAFPERSASLLDFDPVELRGRRDGWTGDKQRRFIEELADCGIVRDAAARVGMTAQSANRLRRRAEAASFSLAWEAALQLGVDRLRQAAYERAVLGVVKPHFYHGRKIGEERVYDNRLLLALLARAPRTPAQAEGGRVLADWERWMEAIEDGAEPPPRRAEAAEPRIWQDVEGRWWTDFRPPSGFASEQRGDYGDEDYCRLCSDEELAAIAAAQARREAEEHRRRDAFFARMK